MIECSSPSPGPHCLGTIFDKALQPGTRGISKQLAIQMALVGIEAVEPLVAGILACGLAIHPHSTLLVHRCIP